MLYPLIALACCVVWLACRAYFAATLTYDIPAEAAVALTDAERKEVFGWRMQVVVRERFVRAPLIVTGISACLVVAGVHRPEAASHVAWLSAVVGSYVVHRFTRER